jgi:hypothetical protein
MVKRKINGQPLKKKNFNFFTRKKEEIKITRTAWAVFKYCGTKTVPLRMEKNKYEKIVLKFISKETNKIRDNN